MSRCIRCLASPPPRRNGADRAGGIATAVPVRHDAGVHRRAVQLAGAGRPPHEARARRPVHRRRSGRVGRRAHMHGHVLLDEQRARRRGRREYTRRRPCDTPPPPSLRPFRTAIGS